MEKKEKKDDILGTKYIDLGEVGKEHEIEKKEREELLEFEDFLVNPSPSETIELPPDPSRNPYIEHPERHKQHTQRHLSKLLKNAISTIKNSQGQTLDEQIVVELARQASEGNLNAISMVFDRVDGKPQQEIDISTGGGVVGLSEEHRAKLNRLLDNPDI